MVAHRLFIKMNVDGCCATARAIVISRGWLRPSTIELHQILHADPVPHSIAENVFTAVHIAGDIILSTGNRDSRLQQSVRRPRCLTPRRCHCRS